MADTVNTQQQQLEEAKAALQRAIAAENNAAVHVAEAALAKLGISATAGEPFTARQPIETANDERGRAFRDQVAFEQAHRQAYQQAQELHNDYQGYIDYLDNEAIRAREAHEQNPGIADVSQAYQNIAREQRRARDRNVLDAKTHAAQAEFARREQERLRSAYPRYPVVNKGAVAANVTAGIAGLGVVGATAKAAEANHARALAEVELNRAEAAAGIPISARSPEVSSLNPVVALERAAERAVHEGGVTARAGSAALLFARAVLDTQPPPPRVRLEGVRPRTPADPTPPPNLTVNENPVRDP